MEKKHEIMSLQKFGKINKRQKKDIMLNTATTVMLAESALAYLAAGIITTNPEFSKVVPALLYTCSALTTGMTALSAHITAKANAKNTEFVSKHVRELNNQLYDAETKFLVRK